MANIPDQLLRLQIAVLAGFLLVVLFLNYRKQREKEARLGSSPPTPPNPATQKTCETLSAEFPNFTYNRKDAELWNCVETYWASQARVPKPALVVKPRNVSQLANVVKRLTEAVKSSTKDEPVQFAVRSGGHSPNRNFANIDAGIVVDLGHFKAIEPSEDYETVTIEPGATWGMVYRKLESHNLAVAGGRASSVGVGGLALGGGLSFFSPQVGFVCDAIVSFEVVLADGSIVTADEKSNPDLAIALRGGGNNFGIVTKLVARTFRQDKVWFGHSFQLPSATDRLIQSYYDFGKADGYDKKATCMFILCWARWLPFVMPVTCLNYAEPTPHPPALRRLSKEKRFWSTFSVRPLSAATDVIEELSSANKQDLFHTTTFENDLETLQRAHAAFKDSISAIKKVSGMIWCLVFQPLVPSATLHYDSNAMGINTDKTLTVMHVSIVWNNAEDAATVHKAAEVLVDRVESFAQQRGVYHPYKYPNYCSEGQNPFPGYGAERHKFLQEVSRRYDPDGIFQKGVPGGPKLWT